MIHPGIIPQMQRVLDEVDRLLVMIPPGHTRALISEAQSSLLNAEVLLVKMSRPIADHIARSDT